MAESNVTCNYWDVFEDMAVVPTIKDVHTVYSIPDVMVDTFSTKTLPPICQYKAFVVTRCTPDSFGQMVESDFFPSLHQSTSWRLYLTELMFGYLKYTLSAQEEPWSQDCPPEMLDDLLSSGKIIILKRKVTVDIPLTIETTGTTLARELKVTFLPAGLISQILEFEIIKADGTSSTATHIGTTIVGDIQRSASGNYSKHVGFPEEFKEVFQCDIGTPTGDLCLNFAATIKLIRLKLYSNLSLQFELGICAADKLVDIWYMWNLYDEFNFKTHVTSEYFEFIQTCLPQFIPAFAADNSDLKCRFHYDCCQFCSNEDCVPGREWGIDCDVEELWIGYNKDIHPYLRINPGSINIPFIHEI